MDRSYHFVVYAGYHQFYLSRDEESLIGSGADSFWTTENIRKLLATGPGLVGVGTGTFGKVPVSVRVAEAAPEDDFTGWDHVTEASLDLCSGRLLITGCPNGPAGHIRVEPGVYRVRIHCGKLDTVREDRGDDHYRIVVWNSPSSVPQVLKQWPTALTF